MVKSVAAPQAKGKSAEDKIFGANNRAVALTEKLGADKVINGPSVLCLMKTAIWLCSMLCKKLIRP